MSDSATVPPARIDSMDPAFRDALGRVTTAIQDASTAAQTAAAAAREATTAVRNVQVALTNLQETTDRNSRDVATIAAGLKDAIAKADRIERNTFGSDMPPASTSTPPTPLDEVAARANDTASRAHLEVAALEGRMIAGFASAEQKQVEIAAELAKQSSAMGLGKRGLAWAVSKEGASMVIRIATLLGVAYGAFRLAVAHSEPPTAQAVPVLVMPAPSSSPLAPDASAR